METVWYKSRTFWAIIVAAVVKLASMFGLIEESAVTSTSEMVLLVLALIFRWQAAGPLTRTSKF